MKKVAQFEFKSPDFKDMQLCIKEHLSPVNFYKIVKRKTIDEKEWLDLHKFFFKDRKFIKDNKDLTFYNEETNTYHCMLVKCKGYDYGILIVSEGYEYARITSTKQLSDM